MNCINACTCWAGQSSQPSTELEDVLSFLEGAGKKQQVTKLRCRTIADTLMERCVLEEAGNFEVDAFSRLHSMSWASYYLYET